MSKKFIAISAGLLVSALACGFFLGAEINGPDNAGENHSREIRLHTGGLTTPLLDCEVHQSDEVREKTAFFDLELEALIREIEIRPGVEKVGVFFRDLENGPIVGANMDEPFIPASLAKLPLLVACLKHSETDPKFLEKKVLFPGLPEKWLKSYHYPPGKTLQEGKEYTVAQMLEYAIEYSDNAAAFMLWETLPEADMDKVLSDVGLNWHQENSRASPAIFARFFRLLYNGSYLNSDNSEKALNLLSKCEFDKGLSQGIPLGVTIAHKFGEMSTRRGGTNKLQLHDCGIVYAEGAPYVLCVMTRGTQFNALEKAIGDISVFVYDRVHKGSALNPVLASPLAALWQAK
ncbi:serine hydrolase [bacterium]|nr:MAG: serine hydrolase [bacterium]